MVTLLVVGSLGAAIGVCIRLGVKSSDILPFVGAFAGAGFAALLSIWAARHIESQRQARDATQVHKLLASILPIIRGLPEEYHPTSDFVRSRLDVAEEGWLLASFQIEYALNPVTNLTWEQRAAISKARSSIGWLFDTRVGIPRPDDEWPRTVKIVTADIEFAIRTLASS